MVFDSKTVQLQETPPLHAKIAATLIFDTDPHLFTYMFGSDHETALKFFELEWKQERSLFSYSHCTVAVNDDMPMGIEIGYNLKTKTELDPDTGHTGAQALNPEDLPILIEAVSYLPYLMPPIQGDAYYIAHLAVIQNMRGQGIGERLLMNAFERAEKQDYRLCELDVASNNRAVHLYLRMGMEIVSESRVVELESNGIPSHYRMAKRFR